MPLLPVVMVTLLLAFSAWLMVKVLSDAFSLVVLKSGPALMPTSPSVLLLM